MRATLHVATQNCIEDSTLALVQRPKWIAAWPSQVVLSVNQLFWTRDVEVAIKQTQAQASGSFSALTSAPKGIQALLVKLNNQVMPKVLDSHMPAFPLRLTHRPPHQCSRGRLAL